MKKVLEFISGAYFIIIFYIGALLIHGFTSYMINDAYGLFFGIISFFTPVIPEIIMTIITIIYNGFINLYTIIIGIYLILVLSAFGLTSLVSAISNKGE